ncbi:MAG: hypothetical protein KatS3mg038_2357 [Candidatus Kapaibacterium sp.]|nr:MAG: hypothetical protein KatS3mg038_2357 [Candidatus Kapabacteria bacterium]
MLLSDWVSTVRNVIAQQLAARGVTVIAAPRTERIEWHAWFGADVQEIESSESGTSRWSLDLVLVGRVDTSRRDAVVSAYADAVQAAREQLATIDTIISSYSVQWYPSETSQSLAWSTVLSLTAEVQAWT